MEDGRGRPGTHQDRRWLIMASYIPSGRVPATIIPLTILYALATLPFAWLYAWITLHVPPVLNVPAAICFALAMGALAQKAASQAKVRNPRWMAGFGTVIGLAGWYVHWAAWLGMATAYQIHTMSGFLLHPLALFETMLGIAKTGTWGLGGDKVKGIMLGLCWLAELFILLSLPRLLGRMRAAAPFCEASNSWAEKIDVPRKFAYINEPHAAAELLAQNPHQLFSILTPWVENISHSHAQVVLHRCRGGEAYLSITNVLAAESEGKARETKEYVVDLLHMPDMDAELLMQDLMSVTGKSADAADAAPVPPELEDAVEALNAERYDAALAAAASHVTAGQRNVRTDARRICAIAGSHLGHWNDALLHWHALFNEEATARNALQIAITSVMTGDVPGGVTWLERARACNRETEQLTEFQLVTTFISSLTQSGHAAVALPYLDEIKRFVVRFGSTDPTLLFMNQLPSFHVFLDNSLPIVHAALEPASRQGWYVAMRPHLDERGQAELDTWLQDRFPPAGAQDATAISSSFNSRIPDGT